MLSNANYNQKEVIVNKKAFWGCLMAALICLGIGLFLAHHEMNQPKDERNLGPFFGLLLFSGFFLILAGEHTETGKARISLPNNGEFQKYSEYRTGGDVLLILYRTDTVPMEQKFYKLQEEVLLDNNWKASPQLPEKFKVLVSWRIVSGQRSVRRPKTEKIYLLIPM